MPDIVVSSLKKNSTARSDIRKVLIYQDLVNKRRFSLQSPEYDYIFDMVGGDAIGCLASMLDVCGMLLVIGNMAGTSVDVSLLPFFERGIKMIGVNAEKISRPERQYIIDQILTHTDARHHGMMAPSVPPEHAVSYISGRIQSQPISSPKVSLIQFR